MKKLNFIFKFLLIFQILLTCSCCPVSNKVKANDETLYQVALLQSLVQGYYDGIITVGELKQHGDTGIGTFQGVNGEMIVLDGIVYQAKSDGSINIPNDDETVPFSNVTFFKADGSLELNKINSMQELQDKLNKLVTEKGKNMFYMVKIKGEFPNIKVRSEYKQKRPYRMLDEALKEDQVEQSLKNISGTVVGLYCPSYMSKLNSAGWHFHFITKDLTKGGHVLTLEIKNATTEYDIKDNFKMHLSDTEEFQNMDLAKDVDKAVKNAETRANNK